MSAEAADTIDVLDVAAEWARVEGLDTDEWEDEDFLEYFYNDIPWASVVEVQWKGGGFAGVKAFGGLYLAYDETETYGPFETVDEAEERLDLEGRPEPMVRYARFPERDRA